jgi:hypothetical protein
MKNQYFGDVNDYQKYSLLRILADDAKIKIGICWMLTDDDTSGQGNDMRHFNQPSKWRPYDADLFDCIQGCVRSRGVRDVRETEKLVLIPSAIYFTKPLKASPDERRSYFAKMLDKFTETDLIFFDPDKGIEVPSMKSAESQKYLLWKELQETFARGHSVLVYQHFPREDHRGFATRKAKEILDCTGAGQIDVLLTSTVVFFLASQRKHQEVLRKLIEKVKQRWNGQIALLENSPAG